jgi:hypothetical protein
MKQNTEMKANSTSFCQEISVCASFMAQQMIQSAHGSEYLELLPQQLSDPLFKFM